MRLQPQNVVDDDLTFQEMDAVNSWRKTILEICIQEMSHLALVANLTTAVGDGAHCFRFDFPVRSGYFPSEFVLELAPFDRETLQHFISSSAQTGEKLLLLERLDEVSDRVGTISSETDDQPPGERNGQGGSNLELKTAQNALGNLRESLGSVSLRAKQ